MPNNKNNSIEVNVNNADLDEKESIDNTLVKSLNNVSANPSPSSLSTTSTDSTVSGNSANISQDSFVNSQKNAIEELRIYNMTKKTSGKSTKNNKQKTDVGTICVHRRGSYISGLT